MEMLPQVRDGREGLSGFAYNLGLGSVPPARSDPVSYTHLDVYKRQG